ncbi:MAG: hypothetical protein LBL35_04800 [Clostridiales bacterium]|nr:hypothetical protein [Clostridiales bacterium]
MTTQSNEAPSATVQKDWANATPAGLVALAVVCAGFFALLSGRVDHSATPLLGCWLIGGFVAQFIVAIIDLKSRSLTGGNTFLYFTCFFMLATGLEMFVKFNADTPLDARLDGYAWGVLAIVTWLWTPAFFTKFSLLSIVVLLLDIALPILALTDLKILGPEYSPIAAWALLGDSLVALYLASGMIVNSAFGKKVYPMP